MKLKDFTNKKNIDPRPSVKFGCAIDRFWDDNNDPLDPNNYYSIGELIDYIQHSNHFSLNGLTGEVELTSNDQSIGIAVGSDNKIDLSVSKAPTSQNQQFAYRSASHDYDNFRIMTLTSPDTKLKYWVSWYGSDNTFGAIKPPISIGSFLSYSGSMTDDDGRYAVIVNTATPTSSDDIVLYAWQLPDDELLDDYVSFNDMGTSMIINEQGELDVNVDNKTITYSKQTVPTTLLTQTTGIPLTLPVGQKITFNLDTWTNPNTDDPDHPVYLVVEKAQTDTVIDVKVKGYTSQITGWTGNELRINKLLGTLWFTNGFEFTNKSTQDVIFTSFKIVSYDNTSTPLKVMVANDTDNAITKNDTGLYVHHGIDSVSDGSGGLITAGGVSFTSFNNDILTIFSHQTPNKLEWTLLNSNNPDNILQFTEAGLFVPKASITDQIQSDWNQTDNTQVDFIKNKPTIPSVPSCDTLVGIRVLDYASMNTMQDWIGGNQYIGENFYYVIYDPNEPVAYRTNKNDNAGYWFENIFDTTSISPFKYDIHTIAVMIAGDPVWTHQIPYAQPLNKTASMADGVSPLVIHVDNGTATVESYRFTDGQAKLYLYKRAS